jgi:NADH dehydrogenase
VEGVDVVIHVVGVLREGGSQTFHGVHVRGTRNLVTAAEQAGARRFIHVGGVHADLDAADALSRTKALAEEEVRRGALEQTILRSSMVFGTPSGVLAGIRGSLRASRPFAILPCGGRGLFQPLWVEDLASCVMACLASEVFNGRTYELGGQDTWSYRELVDLTVRADSLRRLSVSMPPALVLLAASWPRLIGREPLVTRTELRQLCMDNRTDPEVLPREFDVTPTPLTEAMATTFPPTRR